MVSEPMKRTHHYHSFQDPSFFIGLDQFPLAQNDPRRVKAFATGNLTCWRPGCGRAFGGTTELLPKRFKEHLEEELDEWKRE